MAIETKRSTSHGHAADGEDMDNDHADIDLEQNIFDILSTKRMELHMANPAKNPSQLFVIQLQGGAWTQRHTGMAFDSFKCHAKEACTKSWCNAMDFPWNFSSSIRKYTEGGAHALCHLWPSRMCHLKSFHEEHGTIVGAMQHFVEEDSHVATVTALANQGAMDRLAFIRSISA